MLIYTNYNILTKIIQYAFCVIVIYKVLVSLSKN